MAQNKSHYLMLKNRTRSWVRISAPIHFCRPGQRQGQPLHRSAVWAETSTFQKPVVGPPANFIKRVLGTWTSQPVGPFGVLRHPTSERRSEKITTKGSDHSPPWKRTAAAKEILQSSGSWCLYLLKPSLSVTPPTLNYCIRWPYLLCLVERIRPFGQSTPSKTCCKLQRVFTLKVVWVYPENDYQLAKSMTIQSTSNKIHHFNRHLWPING